MMQRMAGKGFKTETKQKESLRFEESEFKVLQKKFNRIAPTGNIDEDRFHDMMGILHLESASFLSKRIFQVIDKDQSGTISFDEFICIMDILLNGEEGEKHEFGFRILDLNGNGSLEYWEFKEAICQIVTLWYAMTGSSIRMDDSITKFLFTKLDSKGNGKISLPDYKQLMATRAAIIPWFELLNYGMDISKEEQAISYRRQQTITIKLLDRVGELKDKIADVYSDCKKIRGVDVKGTLGTEWNTNNKQKVLDKLEEILKIAEDIKIHGENQDKIETPVEEVKEKVHTESPKMDWGNIEVPEMTTRVNSVVQNVHKLKRHSSINIVDENWGLVLNIMLGIRNSIKSTISYADNMITPDHFTIKHRFELVHIKSGKGEKAKQTDTFVDYAPAVFSAIRNMYGLNDEDYLKSMGLEQLIGNLLIGNLSSLQEQCSTGRSGSFFYYSPCGRFLIKTMTKLEFKLLREILVDYYAHFKKYPNTLITRFYGLHKLLNAEHTKKTYLVIMSNSFSTSLQVDLRYDIKGSLYNRKIKKRAEDIIDPGIALKDQDLLNNNEKISIQGEFKERFLAQINEDSKFMGAHNINDYSLLIGIHHLTPEEQENVPKWREQINQYKESNAKPFFELTDGGILDNEGTYVYFMGIIDILTFYGPKKEMEYKLKSMTCGKTISCIPPIDYAERFTKFITDMFI